MVKEIYLFASSVAFFHGRCFFFSFLNLCFTFTSLKDRCKCLSFYIFYLIGVQVSQFHLSWSLLQGFPEILQGVPLNPYTRRYLPPFDEFEVDRCILPQGASSVFPAAPGASIFVVMEGEGTMHTSSYEGLIREGDVLFAPADTDVKVTTSSDLHIYRAGVNSRFFEAS